MNSTHEFKNKDGAKEKKLYLCHYMIEVMFRWMKENTNLNK